MLRTGLAALGLSATLALGSGVPVLAQSTDASDLTAEQLEQLFKKQKTRGLVLAPSGGATTATTTTGATAATAAATDYQAVEKEDQVNIQISFDFDSAALREDQKPKLATLCQVMQSADIQVFQIVGHTDASGSANYNERLSLLRAEEVKRHIVTNCGVAEDRLHAVGVGEQFPFNQENPRADENRRVEFQALS